MTVRIAALLLVTIFAGCSGNVPPTPTNSQTQPTRLPPNTTASPTSPAVTATPTASSAATGTPKSGVNVIAAINVGHGPCAMVELDGSVWVTNYTDDTLVRVDGATNAVAQTVKVGISPCGLAVANGKLWVACLGEGAVVEVDPGSGT